MYGYGDLFSETWKAFTHYDIIHLKNFDSKRVKYFCSTSLVHTFISIWVFWCYLKVCVFHRCVLETHFSLSFQECDMAFSTTPLLYVSSVSFFPHLAFVHLIMFICCLLVYVNASLCDICGCCACDIEYLPCVRLNSSGAVAQIILILMIVCLCPLCANDM